MNREWPIQLKEPLFNQLEIFVRIDEDYIEYEITEVVVMGDLPEQQSAFCVYRAQQFILTKLQPTYNPEMIAENAKKRILTDW